MSTYPDRPGYVPDSDTSIGAADSLTDITVATLRGKIYALIEGFGASGATCDEVETYLGLRHQTASARIRELVLIGKIFDTGWRRLTRSGRKARIYYVRRASFNG